MKLKITIDQHNLFPWVAWTILISFALFVGNLTLEAKEEIESLQLKIDNHETSLQRMRALSSDEE